MVESMENEALMLNRSDIVATFHFANADVLRCVEHAYAARRHHVWLWQEQKPAPWFYRDEGIFLISNGMPHDKEGDVCFVAYADGYDPSVSDVRQKCCDAVGGAHLDGMILLRDHPEIFDDIRNGCDLSLKIQLGRIDHHEQLEPYFGPKQYSMITYASD